MNLFYTQLVKNGKAYLEEEEARHAVQVLRRRTGDRIHLIDGRGNLYEAVIEETGKKSCVARIEHTHADFGKRPYYLHLAVAPTKNISRFEWFLEKATEIGVDRITPLFCEHSERTRLRADRLERVILSAVKQSVKAYLPILDPPTSFDDFLGEELSGERYIAYIDDEVKDHLKENYHPGQDVCILIGPEGDFSPAEVQQARSAGFQAISLGPSRLRTETAAVVACHTIHLLNL